MKKSIAIGLLGGTHASAAAAIGVTPSAVSQWPDELPRRLQDRVIAAWAMRRFEPELRAALDAHSLPPAPREDRETVKEG